MAKADWIVSIGILAFAAVLMEAYRRSTETTLDPWSSAAFDTGTPEAPMSATTLFQPTVQYMSGQSPSVMHTSTAGLSNIETWEGRSNSAYPDKAGNPTIGVGHKIVPGDGLNAQSVINDATVNAIFANDIDDAENIVKSYVTVPLTQGQFDALVDFAFQFGNKLGSSTLLRKLNSRDYAGAAAEFGKWINIRNQATGQLVPSNQLIARRQAATSMFA